MDPRQDSNGSILKSILETMGKLEEFEKGILKSISDIEKAGKIAERALAHLNGSLEEVKGMKEKSESLRKVIRDEQCKWRTK
jgi:hypothetical protein